MTMRRREGSKGDAITVEAVLPISAATVLEALPVSVVVTGSVEEDTPILYANGAFERLTGYTIAEALGKNPRLLQPSPLPRGQVAARRQMAEVVLSRAEGSGRILNRRKDNSAYWAEICIAPLKDDRGVTVGFVAAQLDVTQRVAMDRQLIRERNAAVDHQVSLLLQILWAHSPRAARQSERLCRLVRAAAPDCPHINPRPLALGARLAYVGLVTDTEDVLGLLSKGQELSPPQLATLHAYPEVGAELLSGLPGLEAVSEIVRWHLIPFNPAKPTPGTPVGTAIPRASRVLHVLHELDEQVARMRPPARVLAAMLKDTERFDPDIVKQLGETLPTVIAHGWPGRWEVCAMRVSQLMTGMVLDKDLHDDKGRLLIRQGQEINEAILADLQDLSRRELLRGPIRVARRCA